MFMLEKEIEISNDLARNLERSLYFYIYLGLEIIFFRTRS